MDILRQAKVPQAVQPHLSKCFDGIHSLEFGAGSPGEGQGPLGASNDILAMLSAEGERVVFGRTLKVGRLEAGGWYGVCVKAATVAVCQGLADCQTVRFEPRCA